MSMKNGTLIGVVSATIILMDLFSCYLVSGKKWNNIRKPRSSNRIDCILHIVYHRRSHTGISHATYRSNMLYI